MQLVESNIVNDFKPNINNQYEGEVIDKTTNHIILTFKHKNISEVIQKQAHESMEEKKDPKIMKCYRVN